MTDSEDLLRVRVLGPLEVELNGEPVRLSRRLAILLAVLAAGADVPVTRAQLIDRVWGDRPPADAKQSVQSAVHRLRAATAPGLVLTSGDGYRLDSARVDVDAQRFTDLVHADGGDRRAELSEALDLWRGDPFDGAASPWLAEVEARRLHELHLSALLEHADLTLDAGAGDSTVVSRLSRLTSTYPLHEPLWERLLRALAASDRVPEALERYDEIRGRLRDDLGVDPGAGLRAAYERLLAGDPHRPGPRATGQRQLPSPAARFTGRVAELAELSSVLVRTDVPRIAVVAGVGGVGKTSLVLQWAHSVREHFPDGQLFVDLRGFSEEQPVSAADALSRLLRSLGVPPSQVPRSVEERSTLLRECTTDRDLLIVLDNARDAAQVRDLLPGPGAMTVVTSRNQMRGLAAKQGADRVTLESMPEADAVRLLQHAVGERVDAEPHAARDLVRVCGALPLALSVAAERVTRFPSMPLADLAHEMSEKLGPLEAMSGVADDETDIRTIFAYSYDDLGELEKRVFRYLGMAFGQTTVLHAAAMTGLTHREVRRALEHLVAASLIEQPTPGTFVLHDLLRAFAAERCVEEESPEDVRDAVRRTLAWGQHSLQAAVDAVRPAQVTLDLPDQPFEVQAITDFAHAVRWFEDVRLIVLQWLDLGVRHGLHADVWRLCVQVSVLLEITERRDDASVVAEYALEAAARLDDARVRYATDFLVAQAMQRVDDLNGSIQWLERARAGAREHDDIEAEAIIVTVHGVVLRRVGEHDEGMALQREAIALVDERDRLRPSGVPLRVSRSAVLLNLGGGSYEQYRFDLAIRETEEALEVARAEGDTWREALALNNLSVMSLVADDPVAAQRYAEQTVVMSERLAAPGLAIDARATQGRLLRDAGDLEGARQVWRRALDLLPGQTNPRRLEIVELLEETAG